MCCDCETDEEHEQKIRDREDAEAEYALQELFEREDHR